MSTTTTTTKRTTSKAKPAPVAPIARLTGESDEAFVNRLVRTGEESNIVTAEQVVLTRDDAARLNTFEDRVARSVLAGLTAIGRATMVAGTAPEDYAAVAKALELSTDGGSYLGRKYSTLRECYRIATSHTPELCESFVSAYVAATEQNPEQVREYVQWLSARSDSFRTIETISKRKASAEKAAADAAEEASLRREVTKSLRLAGVVAGCPLTKDEWAHMSEDALRHVAMLAEALASAKGKARRDAARAATANTVAAETGPTPKRTPRTTVAA